MPSQGQLIWFLLLSALYIQNSQTLQWKDQNSQGPRAREELVLARESKPNHITPYWKLSMSSYTWWNFLSLPWSTILLKLPPLPFSDLTSSFQIQCLCTGHAPALCSLHVNALVPGCMSMFLLPLLLLGFCLNAAYLPNQGSIPAHPPALSS